MRDWPRYRTILSEAATTLPRGWAKQYHAADPGLWREIMARGVAEETANWDAGNIGAMGEATRKTIAE